MCTWKRWGRVRSLKNFLRGMETFCPPAMFPTRMSSKTSLEGWKLGYVVEAADAEKTSKTSLEGWKLGLAPVTGRND